MIVNYWLKTRVGRVIKSTSCMDTSMALTATVVVVMNDTSKSADVGAVVLVWVLGADRGINERRSDSRPRFRVLASGGAVRAWPWRLKRRLDG